jgi:uncharacterized protein YdaU (DUF1376 family)
MHEYDHHIGDYTRDTVGLSMLEDGAYRRLMDQCYASELPLPTEMREVYRMARAASATERKAVDYVLRKYFVHREDGWHQNRVDREIAEFHGKSEQAKTAAALRWERERDKKRTADAHATAYPTADADAMRNNKKRNASRAGADAGDHPPPSALHPPPSALPPSELQNRDVDVLPASTPSPSAKPNGQVKGAIGKTEERKAKANTDGAGQQWSHPPYVEATAKTLGIKRRENEDYDAFRDRVYTAVQTGRNAAH